MAADEKSYLEGPIISLEHFTVNIAKGHTINYLTITRKFSDTVFLNIAYTKIQVILLVPL